MIQNCLQELPADYRAVETLRHIAELSYNEIADSIGLPLNTVRTRLHRGRERLGECLEARLLREERP
jgi:RNA polymerase sigma-70 factor (ECF subfamily)